MVTSLFRQILDPTGRYPFRVWDDYQFRQKGIRGSGGGPPGGPDLPPQAQAPVSVGKPVITGTKIQGQPLNCSEGTWTGTATIHFEYQWWMVDPGAGTGTPPSITTSPSLSGSTVRGSILHSTTGLWAGTTPITYHYQWKRLPSTLIGTDSSNYMTVPADVDFTINCTVTAVNSAGSTSQVSSNTKGPITEPVPGEPLTTDEGDILTTDEGEELTS